MDQALAAGHEVRSVVRDPKSLPPYRSGLEVVVADVMDPAAIVDAVRDQDAVISAIGTRNGRKPTTVCTDSARSIVRAMHDAGTKRLVVVSGTGPFDEGEGVPIPVRGTGRQALRLLGARMTPVHVPPFKDETQAARCAVTSLGYGSR